MRKRLRVWDGLPRLAVFELLRLRVKRCSFKGFRLGFEHKHLENASWQRAKGECWACYPSTPPPEAGRRLPGRVIRI